MQTGLSVTHINQSHAAAAAVATAFILLTALTAYTIPQAALADHTNETNVTVSVRSVASATLRPDLYNFSKMDLGETNFSSTHSDLRLVIKNDGSENISDIYLHPDTLLAEQDNPLGTGLASEHAAAKFLWVKNDTSGFYHAGALSWNITDAAGGKPSGLSSSLSLTAWGFYRNATADYLWGLSPDTTSFPNPACNTSSTTLRMKNVQDTGSNRDIDTDSTDYVPDDSNNNWGVDHDGTGSPVTAGPLDGHYVAIDETCEKFYVFRFDNDGQFPTTGNNEQFLVGPGNPKLTPGEEFSGRVGAAVPDGIPAGSTNRTVITIHASGVP